MQEKTQDQLDLQALHRVPARLCATSVISRDKRKLQTSTAEEADGPSVILRYGEMVAVRLS